MYQLHHPYSDEAGLRAFAEDVKARLDANPDAKVMFRLYNDTAERRVTDEAIGIIRSVLPDAPYIGCSTSGNILDGKFTAYELPNLAVVCDILEDPDSKAEIFQYPLDHEHCESTARAILQLIEERPWTKAVGILTTVIDVSMNDFCKMLSAMPESITLFGAGALSTEDIDMFNGLPYVFSSAGANDGHSIVVTLYGGENLHATTQAIVGWKPIGMPLEITSAEGPVIRELDGVPAFERYYHYLKIENDEHFSQNSLLFPLAIDFEGVSIIKAPVRVAQDGSLIVTSDLSQDHTKCRMAYGDPATILESIRESARAVSEFGPQGIIAYSCAARHMYWGDEAVSRETLPFNEIAPVAGFYSGGEFSRHKGKVLHHNLTLVIAGIREGEAARPQGKLSLEETHLDRQMTIVTSLTALVGATTAELEAAYDRMEVIAQTDGLCGILNRREIEARIDKALEQDAAPPAVIMMDIDDFKVVNDAYGHKAGDDVLRRLGKMLREAVDEAGIGSSGRWGGEEFMVVLPSAGADEARAFAQGLCDGFAALDFPASGHHTMSVGVAPALPTETPDLLCQRADKALYAAKKQGKNCVVVA